MKSIGAAAIVIGVVSTAVAQSLPAAADARPRFEVVSIRPCTDIEGRRGAGFSPGRLDLTCQTLATLMREAYMVFAGGGDASPAGYNVRIEGAPDWINADGYLIAAKAADAPPRAVMRGPMLQTVLEDRFKLAIRREERELPTYALTVAPGGFKPRPIDERNCAARDLTKPPVLRAVDPETQKPFCQRIIRSSSGVSGSMTVQELADALSSYVDRPIINRAGISGIFSIDFQFAPIRSLVEGNPPPDPGAGVSIFTAAQEQLGLRLERATGPAPVLVIDHVERPSPN